MGSPILLVVDDDEDLLSLISEVLRLNGFNVETATNGREALDRVGGSMPNLILLDMTMPVMNGWQFAEAFRARYGNDVPIVVVTASTDAALRASQIHAEGWIGKPFDINQLVSVVGRFLPQPV
ncbi:MAG TPA: response regulator [Labilithrix sp.]|nr:response regulator [Labilithrix sp.]